MKNNTIKEKFNHWLTTGGEMDIISAEAIDAAQHRDSYRDAAFHVWREISKGEFTPENLAFIKTVAENVVKIEEYARNPENQEKPTERTRKLARALGLNGTADVHGETRKAIESHPLLHSDEVVSWHDYRSENELRKSLSESEALTYIEKRKAARNEVRSFLKTREDLWPDWQHKPDNSDFDEWMKSIARSYGRKK